MDGAADTIIFRPHTSEDLAFLLSSWGSIYNVSPNLTETNLRNKILRHPKNSPYVLLAKAPSGIELSDCQNITIRELGLSMVLANASSPLFLHIPTVFMGRPKKEMRRIDANRIIAFMENPKPVFWVSKMDFPRNAMGAGGFVIPTYGPISVSASASSPKPTAACFFDSFPKSDLPFFHGGQLS